MLPNGLYEQVINKAIEEELSKGDKISRTEKIDAAESSKVLSSYVAEIIEKSLDILKDSGYDTNQQIEFVNNIIKSAINSSKIAFMYLKGPSNFWLYTTRRIQFSR